MNSKLKLAIEAAIVATVITTTMDSTGYLMFSALPLIALIPFYAWRARIPARDLGYHPGRGLGYIAAIVIPVTTIGLIVLAAWSLGEISETPDDKLWKNILIASLVGSLMIAITEEGFFRGILWRLLESAGFSQYRVIAITTGCFLIWHLSAVLQETDYQPEKALIPIYLVNVVLLGLIWGAMRSLSQTIWVPAIYHSIWNALAYDLFGFGEHTGNLGISSTWLLGPELGLAGILVNLVIGFVCLWLVHKSGKDNPTSA